MKSYSDNNMFSMSRMRRGFSLPEAIAALVIVAFVGANVMIVISRNMYTVSNLSLRMQAFEVARDNMEQLLASDSVSEQVEYGASEKYPDIQWQTVVESFYEPLTSRLWIQAVCTAEYVDSENEIQKVEFTHWLTNLTKAQMLAILDKIKGEQQSLAEADQIIPGVDLAAEYAGVEPEVIEVWVGGGMPTKGPGQFLRMAIDTWVEHDGDPPPEALTLLEDDYHELTGGNLYSSSGATTARTPRGISTSGGGSRSSAGGTLPSGRTQNNTAGIRRYEAPPASSGSQTSVPSSGTPVLGPNPTWDEIMQAVEYLSRGGQ